MASLANVTKEIRIIGKVLAISIASLALLYVLFLGGLFIKNAFFPTPLPPPEQGFGTLPEVNFPPQDPVNYSYVINTVTGMLPSFGDRITVYKTAIKPPTLVALQETRNAAQAAGFTQNETKVTDELYRWTNRQGVTLEINILDNNFRIVSNFLADTPPTGIAPSTSDKETIYNNVLSVLQSLRIPTADFDMERSRILYLKLEEGNVVQAESQSDAQFVRLDLFQSPVNELEIYYPGFDESPMYFILRADGSPRIIYAEFAHSAPDLNMKSTYPLKTTEEAYQDLGSGNAIVISGASSGSSINITDAKVGYYLDAENQPYLLPIFIFEGGDFTGYVKAIRETTGSTSPTQTQ